VEGHAHLWGANADRSALFDGFAGSERLCGRVYHLARCWGAGLPDGAFGTHWFAGLAAIGVILAAVYILLMFQKLFLGPVTKDENRNLLDLNWREIVTLLPLIILIFWIGLYPKPFFMLMAPAVDKLVAILQNASVAMIHERMS